MRGVINHVLDLYIITNCTTAKYILPDIQASSPYLPRTFVSRAHFCLDFRRLLTTSGQSFSAAVRIRPRYLKEVTWERGIQFSVNSVSAPALASSSTRRRRFLYDPCQQKAVFMCRPLREFCDTKISHWGKLG